MWHRSVCPQLQLSPSQLSELHSDLKLQEREEFSWKKLKAEGLDPSGEKEATLIRSLNGNPTANLGGRPGRVLDKGVQGDPQGDTQGPRGLGLCWAVRNGHISLQSLSPSDTPSGVSGFPRGCLKTPFPAAPHSRGNKEGAYTGTYPPAPLHSFPSTAPLHPAHICPPPSYLDTSVPLCYYLPAPPSPLLHACPAWSLEAWWDIQVPEGRKGLCTQLPPGQCEPTAL